jgi:hypothetical protein
MTETSAAATSNLLNGGAPPAAAAVTPAAASHAAQPIGMPVTPIAFDSPDATAARAEIKTKIADPEFYKTLKAEKDRGVTGPASQAWAELHAKGWPAPVADASAQAVARAEQQWNAFVAAQPWPVTPEQEAELRAGVVREDIHKIALQRKDAMVKDKAFYRRLLDGDRAAKEEWGKVIAVIGLRPVKVP